MKKIAVACVLIITAGIIITSCKPKHNNTAPNGNFPPEVGKILVNKCAISGCHNQASYGGADSLLMDTWDHLFDGGSNGAVVVAFSPLYSSMLYFCNTDPTLGVVSTPTMPLSNPGRPFAPLTRDEYMTLYNWIAKGAPDANGNIPFASNPDTRQKFYLTNQGCDLLAVIDAQKKVVMRYIPIGDSGPFSDSGVLSPHCVRVSDDGAHAYVSFLAGGYVQKVDTRTDQVTGSVDISSGSRLSKGSGSWNIIVVSPKDTALLGSDWEANGVLTSVNAATMQVKDVFNQVTWPHGIAPNRTFDTFFVTCQYGNFVYKYIPAAVDNGNPLVKISLTGQTPVVGSTDSGKSSYQNPHEALMAPDFSKYFVTCQGTDEVRVMDPNSDAILKTIKVGTFPQELAFSTTKPYMFVTCMEDNTAYPGAKGSVYVINYNTLDIVTVLYGDFYQPHGITVDDKDGLILIASTNSNPNGPAPHHVTKCGGRDGWYTFYDLNTLQPYKRRYEVTVMPYSAAVRFK